MKASRFLVIAVAVAMLSVVAGCATSKLPSVAESMAPTGPPISLEQIKGAKGDKVSFGPEFTAVMPSGSTPKKGDAGTPGFDLVLYKMPDTDALGLPYFQMTFGEHSKVGAIEDSWTDEVTMKTKAKVSNFKRSIMKWPGADVAVVETWTEETGTAGDSVLVDGLVLVVQTSNGAEAAAMAAAPAGKLDASTSLAALRTLTVG